MRTGRRRIEDRRGAPREGLALLQGIVRCGRCGRRMSVRYLKDGSIPSYECNSDPHALCGRRPASRCAVMRSTRPCRAAFLEAMQPAQLEVSMAAFDQVAAQARQLDRQWQLTLERARYEADLARRRFLAVDPENRLVGRTLERDWNEKLAEVERLERDAALRPGCRPGWSIRGNEAHPGPGAGSAEDLAGPDDRPGRPQAVAGLSDQGRDVVSWRDDDPGGHPLADGGLHDAGGGPTPPLLRGAADRSGGGRPGAGACPGSDRS